MTTPPPPPAPLHDVHGVGAIRFFARLRWRLLRSTLRSGGAQAFATVAGVVVSGVAGLAGGLVVAIAARGVADPGPLLTVAPLAVVVVVIAVGIITGVAQPIDPRVLAIEPLRDRWLTVGLLTTSAFGPPGLATVLFTSGLIAGATTSTSAVGPVAAASLAFLGTLLLLSRLTVNLLALLTIRFPRAGQAVVGLMSLTLYAALQFAPQWVVDLGDERRREVADALASTPPGRLGRAFARAADAPGDALVDAAVGSLWLPFVALALSATTRRILTSTADGVRAGRLAPDQPGPLRRLARTACGPGATGAIAWRGILTRLRQPRTALETFIGGGVGLGIVLVPALTREDAGGAAVLVGGAVQLAVLFMAGNSFGSDGPALGSEILCGVDPGVIVSGKIRSILVVGAPLALSGPLLAASVTGEWRYLPAGLAIGTAGLLSGAGGAIVQATFVPVAVPESDNPLASGDTGSGLLAALMLIVVVTALAIATLPFAIMLVLALSTESVGLVTGAASIAVAGAWGVHRAGRTIATRRWRDREPEIHDALIPAR